MTAERLEVRLDVGRRRKLAHLAAARGISASDAIRQMIDTFYEEALRTQRRQAAAKISQLEVEEVPDPEILSRQLDAVHDLPNLY